MTLEEAVQLANGGDVEAMNALGDHYMSANDYGTAINWFECSAEAEDLYGTQQLAISLTYEAFSLNDRDEYLQALEYFNKAMGYCKSILDLSSDSEFVDSAKEEIMKLFPHIRIGIGIALYEMENYESAAKFLSQEAADGNPDASILYGLCCWELAIQELERNQRKSSYFVDAFQHLRTAQSYQATKLHSKYICRALFNLSGLYRFGVNMTGQAENIEQSYLCLKMILDIPDITDDIQKIVNKKLSHYKKKMFGGYTYVE